MQARQSAGLPCRGYLYRVAPMQLSCRILGALLAWWCLAITTQASVRDGDQQQADSPSQATAASMAKALATHRHSLIAPPPQMASATPYATLNDVHSGDAMRAEADPCTRPGLIPKPPHCLGAGYLCLSSLGAVDAVSLIAPPPRWCPRAVHGAWVAQAAPAPLRRQTTSPM